MKGQPALRNARILSIALTILWIGTMGANAQIIVYEGFQYGVAGTDRASSVLLHGQPDGEGGDIDAIGLGGVWTDSTNVTASSDMFVAEGSLVFGDLATSGNYVRGDSNLNNDAFSRPITGDLSTPSEIWFSVLANKLQNNFSAAEGGLAIANQAVGNPRILLNDGTDGLSGFAVAPTTAGNNWTAYAWDGTSQIVGDAALSVPTNGSEVHLLVGKISFDTGTDGADQYTLYEYLLSGDSIDGGTLSQICSTLEVDVDQTALDTLDLTRQVNTAYDEIRIGASLNDVLGIESVELIGDINGDGVEDAADYIILKENFGTTGSATPEMGDIADGTGAPGADGAVDINDLQLLAAQFAAANAAVPEPATLGLLAIGGLAALRRRRS